jgi:hypothetical protein
MSGAPSVALCRKRTSAELLAARCAKVEAFKANLTQKAARES